MKSNIHIIDLQVARWKTIATTDVCSKVTPVKSIYLLNVWPPKIDIVLSYGAQHFNILNRLDVTHEWFEGFLLIF